MKFWKKIILIYMYIHKNKLIIFIEIKRRDNLETTDKPHTNKICTLFQIKKDRKYLMKFFYLFSFPEILDFFKN